MLWGIAFVVLIGGFMLARQQRELRVDRNRQALYDYAAAAQSRIQRLEDLYQNHLLRLGREVVPETLEAGRAADEIIGIFQVSLLRKSATGIQPFHAIVNAAPNGPVPLPAFSVGSVTGHSVESLVLLDETRLFSRESGWIDEPGKPLMFFVQRTQSEVAVITISRHLVGKSIKKWMREWAEKSFDPIRATGGPDQLRADGSILSQAGVAPLSNPDMFLPLSSRFGSFDLASWDERKIEIYHNPATLAISATVATIIATLGMVVFLTQRRDEAIAIRRVSFVNRVSHELRTPLTNIMLNVDLASELAEDDIQESKHRLALVRGELERLGRLIDNVLTFSRNTQNKTTRVGVYCVPAEIISQVIESFHASFLRRRLTIERFDENTNTSCYCDPDALSQILGNLLSNVDKYAPGDSVIIQSSVVQNELIIRVTDRGPGIPAEAAQRIFEPFERVHSTINEGASGTGLGLFISRDLANSLGGSLVLLTTDNAAGACFELRLPAPPIEIHPDHENPHR
jgi:signal transduction histidine kinase